jgi:tetratricopeptide (TPR) repeat protein
MEEWRGHFTRGVALLHADVTADPMSANARQEYGRSLFFDGDFAQAIAQLDTARALEGGRDRPRRHLTLGEIYLSEGRYGDAETEFRHVLGATPEAPAAHAYLAITYARSGDHARAAAARVDLLARWKAHRSSALWVALAYSGVPDHDSAFAWLESAYRDHSLRPLIMDPTFADLRRDARFPALMRRIGLAAEAITPAPGGARRQEPRRLLQRGSVGME